MGNTKPYIAVTGLAYRLRPVELEDAEFIVQVRLEDAERNRFIHRISPDVELQRQWIAAQQQREGDYYFIVENNLTGEKEGLISIYDTVNNKADWGRWVLRKGSFAALESVALVFRVAFEVLGLDEVYSRTIVENVSVVRFHENNGEKRRCIHKAFFTLEGKPCDAVEHYVDRAYYETELKAILEQKAKRIHQRSSQA